MYLQKNCKLHTFATTNGIFFKSTFSNMHHRETYVYNNFQQNRVSRSVKNIEQISVLLQIFDHKFLTTFPSNIWFAPWFSVQFSLLHEI